MDKQIFEMAKNFVADTPPDVLCVASVAAEAAVIEVLLETLPTLALLATVEGAKETASSIVELMDALDVRLTECDSHVAAHVIRANVEIPDDISSLLD